MKASKRLLGVIGLPIVVALATTGCATKRYAREQAGTVNQRVSEVEKKTNDQIAALGDKEQKDVSRAEERAMTADNKAAEAARAAQQADSKAGQANQLAQTAHQLAQQNEGKLTEFSQTLPQTIENANKYKMVQAEDVLFAFDKATLMPDAKSKLDELVQKASSMNRPVIEVEGFTDKTGSRDYNLALSRRRADAVVRYFVTRNIPLRSIHMIGLGAEQPSEFQASEGNAGQQAMQGTSMSRREARKQARRVVVRIWAPETSLTAAGNVPAQPPQTSTSSQAGQQPTR